MRIKIAKTVHRWGTVAVVFSLCFPNFILAAPNPTSQATIQLGRVGSWKPNQQQLYSGLSRQVQQWIENADGGAIRVLNKNFKIESSFNPVEQVRFELRRTTELLKKGLMMGQPSQSLGTTFERMLRVRKKASQIADLGPEIRDSLFWEGAYYWALKKNDLSSKALERSIKIHPSGLLPEVGDWDFDEKELFNREAFEGFVEKVRSKAVRNCSISLEIIPHDARIRVNGFSWESDQQLWLSSGVSHHLDFEAGGFLPQRQLVSCQSSVSKKLVITLAQNKLESKVAQRQDVDGQSVVLIEPTDNLIKLFLYTPGKYLDEIPLNRAIKLSAAGWEDKEDGNPIVSDAMLGLFRKHDLIADNSKLSTISDSDQGLPPFRPQMQLSHREKSWLESPVFWGIVGGVLVGGAITYFATRNNHAGSVTSDWE